MRKYDPLKGNEKEAFILSAAALIFLATLIYVIFRILVRS